MSENMHDGIEKVQFWNPVIPPLLKIYLTALTHANRDYTWLQLQQIIASELFCNKKRKGFLMMILLRKNSKKNLLN